jgi:NADH dehydrogenase
VEGFDNVWAIGDSAAVPDPARPGQPSPPTAQHVLRQGKIAAHNITAALGRGRKRPFRYRTLGVFVDMGRHQAVAETLGIRWRGFPAWFLARTYHLAQMPGPKRQIRLMTDWTTGLFFGRDSSELGLGEPASLDGGGLDEQSSGGTTSSGQSATRVSTPSAG